MEKKSHKKKTIPGEPLLPTKRRRTALEVMEDRAEMVKLRLRFRKTLNEIAAILSKKYEEETFDYLTGLNAEGKYPPTIGWQQVKKDLEKAKKEFREEAAETLQEKRGEVIRGFADLMGLSHAEYELSKTDKLTITKESRSKDGEETDIEREVTEKRVTGNPAFLRLAFDCIYAIAEMEAAIPPKKIAPTNPEGTEGFKFEGADEFKRLAALANEILGETRQKAPELLTNGKSK